MFVQTPEPPAGWRWGNLFLGPLVHLKQGFPGVRNGDAPFGFTFFFLLGAQKRKKKAQVDRLLAASSGQALFLQQKGSDLWCPTAGGRR